MLTVIGFIAGVIIQITALLVMWQALSRKAKEVINEDVHPSLLWLKDIWTGVANKEITPEAGAMLANSIVAETNKKAKEDALLDDQGGV